MTQNEFNELKWIIKRYFNREDRKKLKGIISRYDNTFSFLENTNKNQKTFHQRYIDKMMSEDREKNKEYNRCFGWGDFRRGYYVVEQFMKEKGVFDDFKYISENSGAYMVSESIFHFPIYRELNITSTELMDVENDEDKLDEYILDKIYQFEQKPKNTMIKGKEKIEIILTGRTRTDEKINFNEKEIDNSTKIETSKEIFIDDFAEYTDPLSLTGKKIKKGI